MKLYDSDDINLSEVSLPVRERGLKYKRDSIMALLGPVAPRAGAWIEIFRCRLHSPPRRSLPVRERGLKLFWLLYIP